MTVETMGPYLDWGKIWKKYSKWFNKEQKHSYWPDFDEQCIMLEKIVEKELDKHVEAWR